MISVIIVTHDSEKEIEACINSIPSHVLGESVEIIVVDAGSNDETKKIVQKYCSSVLLIEVRNIGFAASANLGAAYSRGEILFFLNPDARITKGALDSVVNRFATAGNSEVVGGLLVDEQGIPEKWQAQKFPSLRKILFAHISLGKGFSVKIADSKDNNDVFCNWVSGGAIVLKKETFNKLGGFDERYFLYFEDVDLCKRAKNSGIQVVLDPKLRVIHSGGKSADKITRTIAYDRSQDSYFFKHHSIYEYITARLLRAFFRGRFAVIAVAILALFGLLSLTYGQFLPVLGVGIITLFILFTARSPFIGLLAIFASIIVGQVYRITWLGFSATVTDVLMLLVITAFWVRVVAKGQINMFLQQVFSGWWVIAAFIPGLILAVYRLPMPDVLTMVSYAIRIFAVLLFIPFSFVVDFGFSKARRVFVFTAVMLALVGFLQMIVLPVLPPANETLFSDLFLKFSRGGWDPHQYRLFATWFDPNFLGQFFVMALGLLFVAFEQELKAKRSEKKISLIILASLFIFVALLLTRSRSSFVALSIMYVFYFFLGKTKQLFVAVITLATISLLAMPSFSSRILVMPFSDPTVQLRLQSASQAIGHFMNNPWFGTGYNAYGIEQLESGNIVVANINSVAGTDNFFILLLATTGVWGAIFIVFGLLLFFIKLIRASLGGDTISLSVLLLLVSLLIHAQFVQSFTYIHLLLPLVIIIGLRRKLILEESIKNDTHYINMGVFKTGISK